MPKHYLAKVVLGYASRLIGLCGAKADTKDTILVMMVATNEGHLGCRAM